jgi:hypothetical protein
LEKISKIYKHLDKLKESKSIKLETGKGLSQQIPMKFRGSLWNTLKNYILVNWKI